MPATRVVFSGDGGGKDHSDHIWLLRTSFPRRTAEDARTAASH